MVLSPELVRRLRSLREADFGRGATPHEIDLAEEQLGVEFSASHKAYLEQFGWASMEGLQLFGLGEDVPAHLDLVRVTLSERTEMKPRLPSSLVPLMNDGAGNCAVGGVTRLYCLDVESREQGECAVIFWVSTCAQYRESSASA
jgi:hypothetical protein